jgi:hypothetical protein
VQKLVIESVGALVLQAKMTRIPYI